MQTQKTSGTLSKKLRRFEKKWLKEATQYTRRKTGAHGKRGYVRHDKHKIEWSL